MAPGAENKMDVVLNDVVFDASGMGNFDEVLPLTKFFDWQTDIVRMDTKIEQRNQIDPRPQRRWALNWGVMDEDARDKVIEMFHRARGRYDTFLYTDRHDYSCSATECSITAVGGETTTQLLKNYYVGETETWSENKKDIVPSTTYAPVIKIDGVVQTEDLNFTLDDSAGIIDWAGSGLAAPVGALGAGEVVTVDYQFYFRVRFDSDRYRDFQNLREFWSNPALSLIEVIPS